MDERQAGNFVFLASMAYLPGALLGGKLADRHGRKIIAVGAQLLAGIALVPCGFSILRDAKILSPSMITGPLEVIGLGSSMGTAFFVPILILVSAIFDGFAAPARSAIWTDLTKPDDRQAAFSLGYLGHNIGFAVGPLVAGFLFNAASAWQFWGNAIAVMIAVCLVIVFVPETKPDEETQRASLLSDSLEKAHEGNLFSAIMAKPTLIIFVF